MFCNHCGKPVDDNARFCPSCGNSPQPGTNPTVSDYSAGSPMQPGYNVPAQSASPVAAGSIGYSSRIQDPAFARYVKNTKRWAAIFSIILAIAAIVGFYIAGETGSEMDNPESLYIGLAIGTMFLLIALFQILKKRKSTTWDGIVVDKTVEKKRKKEYYGSDDNSSYRWIEYLLYSVVIRNQEGKVFKLTAENDDTRYNYFQVGDHVRHHGGLDTYEKYDKSRDTISFCNACSSLNDISSEQCFRCKCPLLK